MNTIDRIVIMLVAGFLGILMLFMSEIATFLGFLYLIVAIYNGWRGINR